MLRNREILIFTIISALITAAAVAFCLAVSATSAVISSIACVCIYAVCMVFTVLRYRKIAELADYLEKLSRGKSAMDIRENSEGELSILKNEIYRVTVSLTEVADSLNKDKTELASALSDISHQLKTPLTSLGIMTDLLDDDALLPEKRREFIESIRMGQNRMEWLVLSLLKLAKLDAGAALNQHSVTLSSLVSTALSALLIPMEIKEQAVSVSGEDASVFCDPEWTAEAVCNIVKNAVENAPAGGRITIAYGANPLFNYIEVRDNGSGIDRTDMPNLFKRFYRGKNAGKDSVGIGLSMSLAIMRKQNGDIEVANNEGAVFTLKFYKR